MTSVLNLLLSLKTPFQALLLVFRLEKLTESLNSWKLIRIKLLLKKVKGQRTKWKEFIYAVEAGTS